MDPYEKLPKVPSFSLTSTDVKDGEKLEIPQLSGLFGPNGQDISPQLSWSGFTEGTKSFVVTMYDPDAPSPSGFWHWAVVNIPASVTELPTDAGNPDGSKLPEGSFMIPNDARMKRFIGAAPPPGTGKHRYFIVVHALDVDNPEIDKEATPSLLCLTILGHTLARAIITPWYEAS